MLWSRSVKKCITPTKQCPTAVLVRKKIIKAHVQPNSQVHRHEINSVMIPNTLLFGRHAYIYTFYFSDAKSCKASCKNNWLRNNFVDPQGELGTRQANS